MIIQDILSQSLIGLRKAETIYARVVQLSDFIFREEELENRSTYLQELEFLLDGIKGADTHLTIFNHKTYAPELEVGHTEFWGPLPEGTMEQRMVGILGLLNKEYVKFPIESVEWFTKMLTQIKFEDRENMKIHHCCMRFTRMDKKPICIFSQGMPIQVDEQREFKYTLNFVQNINHLIKKDFQFYWMRFSYGSKKQFVKTFHAEAKEYSNHDLLTVREKEVLQLISEDLDTKEIANRLSISTNTVGNHRSNMIEKLGARDTTALVQLAKMTGMI